MAVISKKRKVGKQHIAFRLEDDLYKLLKEKGRNNLTAYVTSLIVKGLMVDISEIYQDSINKSDTEKFKAKDDEIIRLNKLTESLEIELTYQYKLLINICILGGMEKEKVQKFASDIKGAKDYKGRLRFHNRLIADIARTKNHTMEEITNWMKNE